LGNLSGVLKDMGDYKSAKDGYQKALEMTRNISEKTTFNMHYFGESLRSFEGYGRLQVSQGRLSEGIRNQQETFRRRPHLICQHFGESLRSFEGYGRLQVSQGRLSEGIRN
jgi:tetratricopeptide (TPR) repeat protein